MSEHVCKCEAFDFLGELETDRVFSHICEPSQNLEGVITRLPHQFYRLGLWSLGS